MRSWPRRFVDTGWLWRGPGLVAAVILAATSIVAVVQQREAVRRRDLVFAAQADQLRLEFLEAFDREGGRFLAAVDFVSVTQPGPVDQFHAYFDRRVSGTDDPKAPYDFILVERVPTAGFAALEERERHLGNTDFRVRSSSTGGSRLVVTRTSAPTIGGDIDLVGLDVTAFEDHLPGATPSAGYTLEVLDRDTSLYLFLRAFGRSRDEAEVEAEYWASSYAVLVSAVGDPAAAADGAGWSRLAVRAVSIADLLDTVDRRLADGLEATLLVGESAEPLVTVVGPSGAPEGPVDLRVDHDLLAVGQRWTLSITADATYGPATGLFDNLVTWTFGIVTAALAALALMVRAWHGHRLVRAERELASALTVASTDGLTGLLNRVGFVQQSSRLELAQPATVLFIDLDGFKSVNDLDGHEAGDQVLRRVAAGLAQATRPTDLVSRMGGDEFIIYLRQTASEQIAAQLASRLIDTIDQIDERVSCSIGVALRHPGQVTAVDELLRRADAAMYKVKRSGGRGYHIVRSGPRVTEEDGGADAAVGTRPAAPSGGGAEASRVFRG